MPLFLRDHPPIRAGLEHFLTHDRRFAASGLTLCDITAPMSPELTFATLAETIIAQQLSTKAAATIWNRAAAALEVDDPRIWAAATDETLRALGISPQKIGYLRGLSAAACNEKIDLTAMKQASDDQVIAALTALKGFGVWSAQMILIFTLGRPDVWPAGDLGVQEGLRLYRKQKDRPDAAQTRRYGQRYFTPHASSAALLLWSLKAARTAASQ